MEIGSLKIKRLAFPGRAGELQRQGAVPSLVRELGDNYRRYHGFLAAEAERIGGRPQPGDYPDLDSYLESYAEAQEVVIAESILRACVEFRRKGHPLDKVPDMSVPLVDKRDRLVSFL